MTLCTQSRATPSMLCHLAWPSWSTDSWKHSLLSHTPAVPARVLLDNLVCCAHLITSEASYFLEIFGWLADVGFTTLTSFDWVSVSNLNQPFPREYRSEGSVRSESPLSLVLSIGLGTPTSHLGWLARCITIQ